MKSLPQRSPSPNSQKSLAEMTTGLLYGKYRQVQLPSLKQDRARTQVRKRTSPFRISGQEEDWNDLNSLPVGRLKQLIPQKEVEMDDRNFHPGATAYILEQRAKHDLATHMQAVRLQDARAQARAALLTRHNATEALEHRTGVVKLRKTTIKNKLSFDAAHSASFLSPFGFVRNYQTSPRIRQISQPKATFRPRNPLLYSDFRGLKRVNNGEAMDRLRTSLNMTLGSGIEGKRRDLTPATPYFS